jgi:hypothetical protein
VKKKEIPGLYACTRINTYWYVESEISFESSKHLNICYQQDPTIYMYGRVRANGNETVPPHGLQCSTPPHGLQCSAPPHGLQFSATGCSFYSLHCDSLLKLLSQNKPTVCSHLSRDRPIQFKLLHFRHHLFTIMYLLSFLNMLNLNKMSLPHSPFRKYGVSDGG